ncbi:hypothetical protein ACFC09_26605 [Streptomyces sp. NPDC056161]|uniref:hypothetical protein n=1 Tax=Streptomyces sp. NPDC056161 TaxID=3345732 RepID=UPI0035E38078
MIQYELHLLRSTELRRRAADARLARAALDQRRAARREATARRRGDGREAPSATDTDTDMDMDMESPGRHRLPRAA